MPVVREFRPAPSAAAAAAPRVLLVGDADGRLAEALAHALPAARPTAAATAFDGIVLLNESDFDVVLANAEPIERRPEAAVRALREGLGAAGRLVLFGEASLEPLGRRMLGMGGDGFLKLPADAAELRRVLDGAAPTPRAGESLLPGNLPPAGVVLDALLERGGAALPLAVRRVAALLPPGLRLRLIEGPAEAAENELLAPLHAAVAANGEAKSDLLPAVGVAPRSLALRVPAETPASVRAATQGRLDRLAADLAKLAELDARHAQLQRFALTDELTDCYNRRYFRHFLDTILKKARRERFAVTLLLFDIDDFKLYNDRHGHALGDEILRQSSALIRRCVRDHDLVARIGGDEFAVVFWEKDSPRVPHDPVAAPSGRFPQGPLQIAARFRRLLAEPAFAALGHTGEGSLTISGGMAVYPFDAQTGDDLIAAADRALMQGAKRSGRRTRSRWSATRRRFDTNGKATPRRWCRRGGGWFHGSIVPPNEPAGQSYHKMPRAKYIAAAVVTRRRRLVPRRLGRGRSAVAGLLRDVDAGDLDLEVVLAVALFDVVALAPLVLDHAELLALGRADHVGGHGRALERGANPAWRALPSSPPTSSTRSKVIVTRASSRPRRARRGR